jgi:hypothetical protein
VPPDHAYQPPFNERLSRTSSSVPTALRLAATACAVIWRTAAWTLESLVCVTHKLVLINQAGKSPAPSKTEKENTENIK